MCYEDSFPMLNTNVGWVIDKFSIPLPVVSESWVDYTRHNIRGSFSYSVVLIIYALLISFVVIWFLTIFVLTNYTIKPSYLLRGLTILSSIYMLLVVVKSIVMLHDQQRSGYLHGPKLLDMINNNLAMNILDLIVVLFLQVNQVQVIMRIFLRQRDKRMTFFIGVCALIASQVIWGVSKFHQFDPDDEAGEILPTFIYLVRIVIGLCYAAIISIFMLTKIKHIMANRNIWLLLLLTFILIYSPVAFFIADVSNSFVYELSEVFSVLTYVIGVVLPWEWCNKFNEIMKAKEKEGVLGRKFYEDEIYELDRLELFVEDDDESDTEDDHHPENRPDHTEPKPPPDEPPTKGKTILSALRESKRAFLTLTDTVIAAGFAIPRSVSVSTLTAEQKQPNDHLNTMDEAIMRLQTEQARASETSRQVSHVADTLVTNRRNLYLYAPKEVVIED